MKESKLIKLMRKKNINILLDKINDSGYDSLSEKEKEALYYNSHHLGKNRQKD